MARVRVPRGSLSHQVLGITKRTWRNRAGGLEVRYDVRIRGTGGKRVARTFTRLGHAKAWLDEQRTAKR